jgi:hypothetical protein
VHAPAFGGGLPAYSAAERDYLGEVSVEFFFTAEQAEVFHLWWRDGLKRGGYAFNAGWPAIFPGDMVLLQGSDPVFTHVYVGAHRVTWTLQVKGTSKQVRTACTEGPTWAPAVSMVARTNTTIAYGNGVFVLGQAGGPPGNNAISAYSTDGLTWVSAANGVGNDGYGMYVSYGNGWFFGQTGANTLAARSIDGSVWTALTRPTSYTGPAWFANNRHFVSNGSSFYYTENAGLTFVGPYSFPGGSFPARGVYAFGLHVAIGSYGIYSYDNGQTWQAGTCPSGWLLSRSLAYGNGILVAFGESSSTGNRYRYTKDGINWLPGTLPSTQGWYQVTFADGVFVGVSASGAGLGTSVVTSVDGINWQYAVNPVPALLSYSLIAHNNQGRYCMASIFANNVGAAGSC